MVICDIHGYCRDLVDSVCYELGGTWVLYCSKKDETRAWSGLDTAKNPDFTPLAVITVAAEVLIVWRNSRGCQFSGGSIHGRLIDPSLESPPQL